MTSEGERVDLRSLEKAATEAPWTLDADGLHWGTSWARVPNVADADIALVVALRNAAPFLLDVVEAARDHMAATVEARRTPVAWAGMPPTEGRLHDALLALDSHLSAASEREEETRD